MTETAPGSGPSLSGHTERLHDALVDECMKLADAAPGRPLTEAERMLVKAGASAMFVAVILHGYLEPFPDVAMRRSEAFEEVQKQWTREVIGKQ